MARAPLIIAVVVALQAHLAWTADETPAPSITIRPVSLRLTHDFRKPGKQARAQDQHQVMQVWMGGGMGGGMDNTRAAGCSVGLEVLVDDAWSLVSVGEPTAFKAELDSGETIAAPPAGEPMGGVVIVPTTISAIACAGSCTSRPSRSASSWCAAPRRRSRRRSSAGSPARSRSPWWRRTRSSASRCR